MTMPTPSLEPELTSRRVFLRLSAGLALTTAGILEVGGRCFAAPKPGRWLVACRDIHLKIAGKPDPWSALKELGAAGVEVNVNEELVCPVLSPPERTYRLDTPEEIQRLQADAHAHGTTITALCMNNRLDERLERELVWTRKLVAAAQKLSVTAIRIDVVPRAISGDGFLPFAIKACKQLCDLAEGTPIRFGIENHGHVTNDPQFLDRLFDGVGSPHLGLTLDAMNFYWFGHPLDDLYRLCEKFAPRTVHTHCKNLRYPDDKKNARRPIGWEYEKHAAPLYEGDLDYRRIATILRNADYQGDLCLENECLGHIPAEQHLGVLKREMALLHQVA
jgi:sugar phosphate isomerase/epimerase